jgi:hypothetical protein
MSLTGEKLWSRLKNERKKTRLPRRRSYLNAKEAEVRVQQPEIANYSSKNTFGNVKNEIKIDDQKWVEIESNAGGNDAARGKIDRQSIGCT